MATFVSDANGSRVENCGQLPKKDPETGMYHFGDADHFFSYNWDSPFDDVVDAICAHSGRRIAMGKSPGYYFIDNFAMSQHNGQYEAKTIASSMTNAMPSANATKHNQNTY